MLKKGRPVTGPIKAPASYSASGQSVEEIEKLRARSRLKDQERRERCQTAHRKEAREFARFDQDRLGVGGDWGGWAEATPVVLRQHPASEVAAPPRAMSTGGASPAQQEVVSQMTLMALGQEDDSACFGEVDLGSGWGM